jgi:predicted metalloprotease with PDZ domain
LILEGLRSEKFADRENAQAKLREWAMGSPAKAVENLFKEVRNAEDPEIRTRCLDTLKEVVLNREFRADGFLGISMQEVEIKLPDGAGARAIRVTRVIEESAAGQAGISEGALIVGLGDRRWKNEGMITEFREKVKLMRPGTMVTLQFLENGAIVSKVLKLGGRIPPIGGVDDEDPIKAYEERRESFFRKWLNKRMKLPR